MSAIALVTDSTANLPEELVRRYDVTVVPLYVRFGETVWKDYVELPPAEFYKHLAETRAAGGELPKTSQPTPSDFEGAYLALARGGAEDVLSVHVAAKMSGTLNSAQVAGEMVTPQTRVRAVDSTTISMQMSYMVVEAAEAIRHGGGIQEAVEAVEKVKANSCTYFTVTEVEHIEASGRVEGAAQVAETEIKVRPVIGIFDGQAKVVSPERTQRAATEKVIELTRQRLRGLRLKGVTVVHTNALERAEALKARVPAEMGYQGQVFVVDMGPALAVHVGPGVVGLAAYGE
ncbi:MAG: DegV family protein [Chloroflexi bacterium]|nr:DegV family protein [Chloroflexota bacterium]